MKLLRNSVSRWLSLIQKFLEQFGWLADSFVLEFYVDNHWDKLLPCWRQYLDTLCPEVLSRLLNLERLGWGGKKVPPLSLLAFKQTVRVLSIPRTLEAFELGTGKGKVNEEFKKLFTRHVKLKKRHEVEKMGEVVSCLCAVTGATNVYDVGSGLGHLSRYLTYACGLNLTCVDREEAFGVGATKFDIELESFLSKKLKNSETAAYEVPPPPPSHLSLQLELNTHENYFQSQNHLFGIIGLHSCGNLSPVVLHNFVNSPAGFVVSLGCCYMKLDKEGFPLSSYTRDIGLQVSYEALEVACHALEQYRDRLVSKSDLDKLLTHSYRAALEVILRQHGLTRTGLRSVPHTHKLSFEEYASKATAPLNIDLNPSQISSPEIQANLKRWFQVVLFYSLRLLVANVIESALLLDRGLFLLQDDELENAGNVHIVPIFDPKISARNLALISWRSKVTK